MYVYTHMYTYMDLVFRVWGVRELHRVLYKDQGLHRAKRPKWNDMEHA